MHSLVYNPEKINNMEARTDKNEWLYKKRPSAEPPKGAAPVPIDEKPINPTYHDLDALQTISPEEFVNLQKEEIEKLDDKLKKNLPESILKNMPVATQVLEIDPTMLLGNCAVQEKLQEIMSNKQTEAERLEEERKQGLIENSTAWKNIQVKPKEKVKTTLFFAPGAYKKTKPYQMWIKIRFFFKEKRYKKIDERILNYLEKKAEERKMAKNNKKPFSFDILKVRRFGHHEERLTKFLK